MTNKRDEEDNYSWLDNYSSEPVAVNPESADELLGSPLDMSTPPLLASEPEFPSIEMPVPTISDGVRAVDLAVTDFPAPELPPLQRDVPADDGAGEPAPVRRAPQPAVRKTPRPSSARSGVQPAPPVMPPPPVSMGQPPPPPRTAVPGSASAPPQLGSAPRAQLPNRPPIQRPSEPTSIDRFFRRVGFRILVAAIVFALLGGRGLFSNDEIRTPVTTDIPDITAILEGPEIELGDCFKVPPSRSFSLTRSIERENCSGPHQAQAYAGVTGSIAEVESLCAEARAAALDEGQFVLSGLPSDVRYSYVAGLIRHDCTIESPSGQLIGSIFGE